MVKDGNMMWNETVKANCSRDRSNAESSMACLLSPQIGFCEVEDLFSAAADDCAVPIDMLLAPHRVHHRRLQPFAERQEFVVCGCASRTAQDRHVAVAVQEAGQMIEFSRDRQGVREVISDRPWHI